MEDYGFFRSSTAKNGEGLYEKAMVQGTPARVAGESDMAGVHRIYPRYFDGPAVGKFVIPIRPGYHAKLFPEAQSPAAVASPVGRPGNTIKKVYLCNSPSNQLRPGDLLFFYVTQYSGDLSQTLATVGVIESVRIGSKIEDVRRWTAKRSVFSDQELVAWVAAKKSIKVIDFLHVGHIDPPINLAAAVKKRVLASHPQSIVKLDEKEYARLKSLMPSGLWG